MINGVFVIFCFFLSARGVELCKARSHDSLSSRAASGKMAMVNPLPFLDFLKLCGMEMIKNRPFANFSLEFYEFR